jgi:hypothetical protein
MPKAKTVVEEVTVEDIVVVEDTVVVEDAVVVEEVAVEDLPHPNPIIQMAIDQAKERLLRETAE